MGALFWSPYRDQNKYMEIHYFCDPKTKSVCEIMMIIFLDYKDIIYQHAAPPKMYENGKYYIWVLKVLWQHKAKKGHELIGNRILNHGNALSHVTTIVQ